MERVVFAGVVRLVCRDGIALFVGFDLRGAVNTLDYVVLALTLIGVLVIGLYQIKTTQGADGYWKGGQQLGWFTVGLSVLATQASAITFLSAPGLCYESGLRFVQFYLGLPIALVLISAFFLPLYYRSGVFTAYEYLEKRFDLRMRLLTSGLFLIQRGLAAGLTIYAPAIVLSTVFNWNLDWVILGTGGFVIVYTVGGGVKAVSMTQKGQMAVILLGMVLASVFLYRSLSQEYSFHEMLSLAGRSGRLMAIDTHWDLNERYTLWSGLLGGLFLSLSYFGTDQSQVQRYLGGANLKQSRMGLMFNALIKIPMQLGILFIGVLVYLWFLGERPPVHFNLQALERLKQTEMAEPLVLAEAEFDKNFNITQMVREDYLSALRRGDPYARNMASEGLQLCAEREGMIREEVRAMIEATAPGQTVKDTNYVFLYYVLHYLPHGLIGLLLAVILSAAMSSTSGELSALASCTLIDFWDRLRPRSAESSEEKKVRNARWATALWGVLALIFAFSAELFDNLIEMVNVLGSLFYGTILGIFVLAFFVPKVGARSAFYAALFAETAVLLVHFSQVFEWPGHQRIAMEYLWYNVLGCVLLVGMGWVLEGVSQVRRTQS